MIREHGFYKIKLNKSSPVLEMEWTGYWWKMKGSNKKYYDKDIYLIIEKI